MPTNRQAVGYFWRLARMIKDYWPRLTVGLIVGLFMTGFALVPPLMTKLLVDNVYVTKDVSLLHFVLLTTLALTIASAIIGAIRNYFTTIVGSELASATSLMFFAHIVAQPVRFFDTRRTGEILSRTSDVRSSLGAVTRIFSTVLTSGLQLIVVPPVLFYLNWKLAALSLIGLPLTTAISVASSRLVRKYTKLAAEASAEMTSSQIDALTQVRTVKLLCAEREIFGQVRDMSQTTLRLQLTSSAILAVVGVLRAVVSGVATALFTWYGWISILDQNMTLGGFLAFSAYLRYLTAPVASLSSLVADFHTSSVSLGRFFEYLDFEPEMPSRSLFEPGAPACRRLDGSIEFRRVSFAYESGSPVLNSISFALPHGATMAIVGESGAGKSTLVRLLCRMDVAQDGDILLGQVPIRDLRPFEVRSHIAAVWQETGLFRGTLRQNLLLGVPDEGAHRMESVLDVCQLRKFLDSLPNGLDSPLGEAGVTVSGGQRQRIVLARAILRNSPLLVLDEATSSIDSSTESNLLRGILEMERRKTIVFVTHRVHTAELADFVLVMNNGAVDGFGTHADLLSTNLLYRALWKAASAEEHDEEPQGMLVGSA